MEKKISTDMRDDGLRGMAKGTVRFSIKADDTLENFHVHETFREFCRIECDNNYTQGLRKLLEYWEMEAKTSVIYEAISKHGMDIEELKTAIAELSKSKKVINNKEKEEEAF